MSQDYGPAIWMPTTHYWAGRRGYTPRWIIVHGTAGGTTATGIGHYFQTNDPPTSTHYVVGLDGEVVQCVGEADSAWGNGIVTQGHDPWWSPQLNPNFVTISIEHVKPDTQNRNQLTQAQQNASFALIKHLCEKWNIPMRPADASGGITGHHSIDPINRAFCPGPYPFNDLWNYLNAASHPAVSHPASQPVVQQVAQPVPAAPVAPAASTMQAAPYQPATPAPSTTATQPGVPAGWSDDGAVLTAPNGQHVNLGFRWYILHNPWDSQNWPLEPAHVVSQVDPNNPQSGRGTIQHFRMSILVWEEATSAVYALWAGQVAYTLRQTPTTQPDPLSQLSTAQPSGTVPSSISFPATGMGAGGATAGAAAPTTTTLMPYASPAAPNGPTLPSSMPSSTITAQQQSSTISPSSIAAGLGGMVATVATGIGTALANGQMPIGVPSAPTTTFSPSSQSPLYSSNATPSLQYIPGSTIASPGGVNLGASTLPSSQPATAHAVNAPTVNDALGQRVSQLENQIRSLIGNLAGNVTGNVAGGASLQPTGNLQSDLLTGAEEIGQLVTDPKVRKSIFANPRTLIRWVLMIVGLLFSDVLAWVVSSISHNAIHMQLPFITVGTVVSGLAFISAFILRTPHH